MRSSRSGAKSSLPPRLESTVKYRHTFRYTFNTTQSQVGVTGQMLAGAFGGVCSTANSVLACWTSTARITRVTIWPAVSTSVVGYAEVSWLGPVTDIRKDTSPLVDIPTGVTVTSKVVSKPPKGSFCEDWISLKDLGSQILFYVSGLAGSVLDVSVDGTLGNNIARYALGITTGTLGTVYYTSLDGPGVNNIRPSGLPTTS